MSPTARLRTSARTVIAGDSWGEIAVPVIEAHPSTALIFVGAYLTIVFGVLNLIVAVVVPWENDEEQNGQNGRS